MSLLCHEENLPATIASVKLLRRRARGASAAGLALVALVATRQPPFWATTRPTARRRTSRVRRPTDSTPAAAWELLRDAGRAGPAPGRIGGARALARRLRRLLPQRPLRGGAGRPAQRRRHGARARAGLHRASAPTTTPRTSPASWAPTTARPAPPSLVSSWRARSSVPGTRSSSSCSTARRARAARPTGCSQREACAAPRWPRRATATPGRWCCSTSSGDRRLSLPREGSSDPGLWGAARRGSGGRRRPSFPAVHARLDPRRPHPLPAAGRAGDRPDRLRLPLLAPALRRPVERLGAQPRRDRGGRVPLRSLASDADGLGPREAAAGGAARLLRGRRPRRSDGRARARAVRAAGLRAQGDRAQQARGRAAARARRDLRRGGDRGAGGRRP